MIRRKVAKLFFCFFIVITILSLGAQEEYIRKGLNVENIYVGGGLNQEIIIPSKESGYYDTPFALTLSVPDKKVIYYTTDGSVPTRESIAYESPIWIEDISENPNVWAERMGNNYNGSDVYTIPDYNLDKATVIRAVAYEGERRLGTDIVLVYFVGTKNKEIYSSLPVMSLVCDGEDLFDEDNGIYTNFWKRGKEAERPVHVDYFQEDFELKFSQNMGVRIRGGASREMAQKGFNLFAREEYGFPAIDNIFDESDSPLTSLSIVTEYDEAKVKDIISYQLSEDLHFGTIKSFPCNLFINGEYWGIYFLSERFDNNYFNRYYGVEEKDILLIDSDTVGIGEEEDIRYYQELTDFAKEYDLSDDENYTLFSEMVDIESLIDYYCFECYIYNQDWPYHNYALWRTKNTDVNTPYGDGKWRFLLYDTNYEEAMNLHSGKDDPYLLLTEDYLIPYVMKNKTFREKFAIRMCDMANIIGEVYKVETLLDDLGGDIKESVMLSERRFYGRENYDVTEKLEKDMLQFFYVRPEYIVNQTKDILQIDGEISSFVIITDDPSAGEVEVNGLPIDLSYGSWEGKYYSGLKVKVTASANESYTFGGWEILSQDGQQLGSDADEFSVPSTGIVIKTIWG